MASSTSSNQRETPPTPAPPDPASNAPEPQTPSPARTTTTVQLSMTPSRPLGTSASHHQGVVAPAPCNAPAWPDRPTPTSATREGEGSLPPLTPHGLRSLAHPDDGKERGGRTARGRRRLGFLPSRPRERQSGEKLLEFPIGRSYTYFLPFCAISSQFPSARLCNTCCTLSMR